MTLTYADIFPDRSIWYTNSNGAKETFNGMVLMRPKKLMLRRDGTEMLFTKLGFV
jgi:hypothetical protein